jgi:hypothetical protein
MFSGVTPLSSGLGLSDGAKVSRGMCGWCNCVHARSAVVQLGHSGACQHPAAWLHIGGCFDVVQHCNRQQRQT